MRRYIFYVWVSQISFVHYYQYVCNAADKMFFLQFWVYLRTEKDNILKVFKEYYCALQWTGITHTEMTEDHPSHLLSWIYFFIKVAANVYICWI